jgi:hypothetical protein
LDSIFFSGIEARKKIKVNKETTKTLIEKLAASEEPALRYKVHADILQEDPASKSILDLQKEVKGSVLVKTLLGAVQPGQDNNPFQGVYKKWSGPHWILASLADLGYPPGDTDIRPLRDRVLDSWLDPYYLKTVQFEATPPYHKLKEGVPVIQGRARRCASQQGNALYASLKLGFMDERCDQLAELLIGWQWPDGGWNCDKKAEAAHSSFWESLLPLRGLASYSKLSNNAKARQAVERAAEIFLERHLYKRLSDSRTMNVQFTRLRYPNYWRYNILAGLIVLSEAGFLEDHRCREALDLLESKQLPGGGWAAEDRYYQTTKPDISGYSPVDWGGVSKRKMNPWVTVDALTVLRRAGRV